MVDLNKLRVLDLKALAKECNVNITKKLKADIIQQIKSAAINKDHLTNLFNKYNKSKPPTRKKSSSTVNLESRINELEKQVKFLIDKLKTIEAHLSLNEVQPKKSSGIDIDQLKGLLISTIPRTDSLTIDEIYKSKPFNKVPFKIFEKAIIELIDDEYFDGSAGKSKYKVDGTIGRIIRR